MSKEGIFQIIYRDGMGRVGKLKTSHGEVTTPTLMPVINPIDIFLTPRKICREFGAEIIMTNAYSIWCHFRKSAEKIGIHRMLRYNGPIATDSGGFQILRYGSVDVTPEEIVRYQDVIAPDIATILDIPTGVRATRELACETIRITLDRARQATKIRSNPNVMWCAPVQGGTFSDLVIESAKELGDMDYQLHAIGSPVELFEEYRYAEIVDLVMAAKQHLPLERPVHLFGAGHPMVFALAVLMGCDLFDSAAYVLYAKSGRYLTSDKTLRLDELDCLPCECPICVEHSLGEIKKAEQKERVKLLARHNLHVSFGELRRVRQAIVEGRLWEYAELRCRAHPRLLDGMRRLARYKNFIERFDPVTKPSAFYYIGPESADRPEVVRHHKRLGRYEPPTAKNLVLIPGHKRIKLKLENPEQTCVIKLVPPFGVVPEELEEVYPLSQFQVPRELDVKQVESVTSSLIEYLRRFEKRYERIILFDDSGSWSKSLVDACGIVEKKLKILPLDSAKNKYASLAFQEGEHVR